MTCVPAYSLHRPQRPPLTPGPVCAGEVGYWDWGGRAHHGTRNSPPGNGRNSGQMPRSNRPDSTAAIHVAGRRRPSDGRQPCRRAPRLTARAPGWVVACGRGSRRPGRAGRRSVETQPPLPFAPAAVESKTTTVRYRPTRRTACHSRLPRAPPSFLACFLPPPPPAPACAARVFLYHPSSASSPTQHHSLAGPRLLRARVEIQGPRGEPSRRSARPRDT